MKQKVKNMGYAKAVSLTVWLFAAMAIVGFSSLLVYMDQYEKGQLTENRTINIKEFLQDAEKLRIVENKDQKDKTAAKSQDKPQESKTPNKHKSDKSHDPAAEGARPTFDFYSLLPEMEVVVPDKEMQPRAKPKNIPAKENQANSNGNSPEKTTAKTTVNKTLGPSESYFIQAGAFKDLRSADRRKANLALIGIKSAIVSVNLKSRGVWHRVRVGPFADIDKMSRVRSVMKTNNITSITVKVKS